MRKIRSLLRKYAKEHPDPLAHPLSGGWRTIYEREPDDLSDGPTYYCIMPGEYTDEEIDEIREDETLRCRSPFDCSGEQFTWSFHISRTPAGLACINRTGFDY